MSSPLDLVSVTVAYPTWWKNLVGKLRQEKHPVYNMYSNATIAASRDIYVGWSYCNLNRIGKGLMMVLSEKNPPDSAWSGFLSSASDAALGSGRKSGINKCPISLSYLIGRGFAVEYSETGPSGEGGRYPFGTITEAAPPLREISI